MTECCEFRWLYVSWRVQSKQFDEFIIQLNGDAAHVERCLSDRTMTVHFRNWKMICFVTCFHVRPESSVEASVWNKSLTSIDLEICKLRSTVRCDEFTNADSGVESFPTSFVFVSCNYPLTIGAASAPSSRGMSCWFACVDTVVLMTQHKWDLHMRRAAPSKARKSRRHEFPQIKYTRYSLFSAHCTRICNKSHGKAYRRLLTSSSASIQCNGSFYYIPGLQVITNKILV